MRSHSSILLSRILRAGLRVSACRYRVVAVGLDHRSRIICITTNTPRLSKQGYHAEERLIFRTPQSLSTIILARVGASGELRPIDPCPRCQRLADKRKIKIESI